MLVKDTLQAKWFWYTMLCVMSWIPLALVSKLGTDAFKNETITSALRARSIGSATKQPNVRAIIEKGLLTEEQGEKIMKDGDASATGLMNLLTILGSLPVALVLFATRRFTIENNLKGVVFGLTTGVLGMVGFVGLFFAFAYAPSATLVSVSTGLFPMVTIALAVLFLRERLTWVQVVGLGFAAAAIVIFSLPGN